jgi:hypothetical protein
MRESLNRRWRVAALGFFAIAIFCRPSSLIAEERIWGTIVSENDDHYIAEAEDGKFYDAEWYADDSSWNVGDLVILTSASAKRSIRSRFISKI